MKKTSVCNNDIQMNMMVINAANKNLKSNLRLKVFFIAINVTDIKRVIIGKNPNIPVPTKTSR